MGYERRGRSEYHKLIINILKAIKVLKLWRRPGLERYGADTKVKIKLKIEMYKLKSYHCTACDCCLIRQNLQCAL